MPDCFHSATDMLVFSHLLGSSVVSLPLIRLVYNYQSVASGWLPTEAFG